MNSLRTEIDTGKSLEIYLLKHREVLDVIPHPAFIIDTDHNIVYCNAAMKSCYSELNNIGAVKCYQLFQHTDSPDRNCPLASLSAENERSKGVEIYLPSLNKYLYVYSAPILKNETLLGTFHSVLDVSASRSAEEEYRELVEVYASAINNMKVREQKAKIGKDAFLNMLEDLNDSYKDLEELFIKLIRAMISALDAKSPWTKGHSERVSMYAEHIGREMLIDGDELKKITLAGLLHDIGKIGTYDSLLDKPGRLTVDEFEIVKLHPSQGAQILKGIKQLKDIIPLVEYHHEKIDGTGYPYKLKGEKIPLGARILHVADSFDSMTSDRPYRAAPGVAFALSELIKHKGSQFDPEIVEAFLSVLEKNNRFNLQ